MEVERRGGVTEGEKERGVNVSYRADEHHVKTPSYHLLGIIPMRISYLHKTSDGQFFFCLRGVGAWAMMMMMMKKGHSLDEWMNKKLSFSLSVWLLSNNKRVLAFVWFMLL